MGRLKQAAASVAARAPLKVAERASKWPAQRIINFLAILGFLGGLACQFGLHP